MKLKLIFTACLEKFSLSPPPWHCPVEAQAPKPPGSRRLCISHKTTYPIWWFFLSILIIIYKDNNKDDTTGSKLIVIYPVAITQRGASERYVSSQGWIREQGKGVKLGKTMIRENLHTLVQGEIVGKSNLVVVVCLEKAKIDGSQVTF